MSLLIAFSGQGLQHSKMFNALRQDNFGNDWLKKASQMINVDLLNELAVQKACGDPIKAQLLISILSVGSFYALQKSVNLSPDFLCGYSLGEISAFCVSANLSLQEICSLVEQRASIMLKATNNQASGLAVLKGRINFALMNKLITSHSCYLAIVNAEDYYIIGGLLTNLDQLLNEAKTCGVLKAERLAVNLPSHTPLLAKATEDFAIYLRNFKNYSMQYPILNALSQELVVNTQAILPILAKELSQTLHWDKVLQIAGEYDLSFFLELGPGSSLKKMVLAQSPALKAYNLESFSSLSGLAKFIAIG